MIRGVVRDWFWLRLADVKVDEISDGGRYIVRIFPSWETYPNVLLDHELDHYVIDHLQ